MRGMMRLAIMGVPGTQGGGGIEWLLRDEFLTDEAAPLTSPRTAEPGPGTLTLVQNDGQFSISGGKFVFTANTTPDYSDEQMYLSTGLPYESGIALGATINLSTLNHCTLGFMHDVYAVHKATGDYFFITTGSEFRVATRGAFIYVTPGPSVDTDYVLWTVETDSGAMYFVNSRLFWVDRYTPSYTSVFPAFNSYGSAGTIDYLRARVMPGLTSLDTIASVNQATPTSGTSYTATADAIHDLTVTAPNPLAESAHLRYRVADDNNYWDAYFDAAGAFRLDSVAAGTPTNRINVAGAIVAGETRTIRVWTYGSLHNCFTRAGIATGWTRRGGQIALAHQDAAAAIKPVAGVGWVLGALRSYPTTSPAYAELDRT